MLVFTGVILDAANVQVVRSTAGARAAVRTVRVWENTFIHAHINQTGN